MLSIYGLWVGRDLYRAAPAEAHGIVLSGLKWGPPQVSRFKDKQKVLRNYDQSIVTITMEK